MIDLSKLDLPSAYSRFQTGIAMAKSESVALQQCLRQVAATFRRQADEIDAFLETAAKHTDSWHEAIVEENDEIQKRHRDSLSKAGGTK